MTPENILVIFDIMDSLMIPVLKIKAMMLSCYVEIK